MKTTDRRRDILAQICLARKEYFRIQGELANLPDTLPPGCYIGNYISNYKYTYHALGHKDAVLPCAKSDRLTKKLHLGRDFNPNYREAAIALEATRVRQVKVETLTHIKSHLEALKSLWKAWKAWDERDDRDKEFQKIVKELQVSVQQESIIAFIRRQRDEQR